MKRSSDSNGRYILDEVGTPVPCEDLFDWASWMETADRTVKTTDLPDGGRVSTVFLGLDHGYRGTPLLFETMVFSASGEALDQWRYQTRSAAEAGHDDVAARLIRLI